MERAALENNLKGLLTERKAGLVKKWFEGVVATYPSDSASFLRNTAAQFTNPVGYTLSQGLEGIFDGLINGMMPDAVIAFLDGMVRIRAVQDFTPSEAVSFIFNIKKVIREELETEILSRNLGAELAELDSAVDDLALFAFDLYMQCRERLYDIRAREAERATFRLLQKARLISGGEGQDEGGAR